MKLRTRTIVKLTNGRVNLDYTFVSGTPLAKLAEELLTQIAFQDGKDAVIALANKVADSVPNLEGKGLATTDSNKGDEV